LGEFPSSNPGQRLKKTSRFRQSGGEGRRSGAVNHCAREFRFCYQRSVYKRLTSHLVVAFAASHDPDLKPNLVTRADRLTEAALVDAREIDELRLTILIAEKKENDTDLRQGFHNQDAGHDGVRREVTLEKGFVYRDVLQADSSGAPIGFDNLVNQQERIAVRDRMKDLPDPDVRQAFLHGYSLSEARMRGKKGMMFLSDHPLNLSLAT
jgi:hypothetical protein